jgi:hypothetical protein
MEQNGPQEARRIDPRGSTDHIREVTTVNPNSMSELQNTTLEDVRSTSCSLALERQRHKAEMKKIREAKIHEARTNTERAFIAEQCARAAVAKERTKKRAEKNRQKEEAAKKRAVQKASVSEEIRDLILQHARLGHGPAVISQFVMVKRETVKTILRRHRRNQQKGGLAPLRLRGSSHPDVRKKPLFSDTDILWCARYIICNPSATYSQVLTALAEHNDRPQGYSRHAFKTLQRKLRHAVGIRAADFLKIPVQRNAEETKAKRRAWVQKMFTMEQQFDHAIFIDETGFNACTQPVKGKSLMGVQPVLTTDKLDIPNLSVIMAVSKSAIVFQEAFVGGVNGKTYAGFLDRMLSHIQATNGFPSGFKLLVIADNCSIHKERRFVQTICGKWKDNVEFEFLPPYSPFLDPCEEIFSVWKYFYCEELAKLRATTVYGVCELVCKAQLRITKEHCQKAWYHSRTFWAPSLKGDNIASSDIIDGVHEGDEVAAAREQIFKSWGMANRPNQECLSPEARSLPETDDVRHPVFTSSSGGQVDPEQEIVVTPKSTPTNNVMKITDVTPGILVFTDVSGDEKSCTTSPSVSSLSSICSDDGDDVYACEQEDDSSELEDDPANGHRRIEADAFDSDSETEQRPQDTNNLL